VSAAVDLPRDPTAEELLSRGWVRSSRDDWWRDPLSQRSYPEGDALRICRADRAQECEHQALTYAPDELTAVEGAVRVTCAGCGWARTATRAA
jgi:hypothetical protein